LELPDDLECEREKLDRPLIDAKSLGRGACSRYRPVTLVKDNVHGGVDVQVQVNVDVL